MHATFRQYLMFHEFKYILYNCYSQYKYLGQESIADLSCFVKIFIHSCNFFLMHILVIYVTQNGV